MVPSVWYKKWENWFGVCPLVAGPVCHSTFVYSDMTFFCRIAEIQPSFSVTPEYHWFVWFIFLSLPSIYYYTIRSMAMLLKVQIKINFRGPSQI